LDLFDGHHEPEERHWQGLPRDLQVILMTHTRAKRAHSADAEVARTWLTDEIIVGQESVAELLGTQQVPCGWNLW
jgi:hypothetical protein